MAAVTVHGDFEAQENESLPTSTPSVCHEKLDTTFESCYIVLKTTAGTESFFPSRHIIAEHSHSDGNRQWWGCGLNGAQPRI